MGNKHTRNKHDMENFELEELPRPSDKFADEAWIIQKMWRPSYTGFFSRRGVFAAGYRVAPMFSVEKNPRVSANFLQTCRSAKREVDSKQDEEESVTLTSMDMDLLATQPKPTEPPSHSWTKYEGPRGLHLRCRRWGQPTSSVRKSMECERSTMLVGDLRAISEDPESGPDFPKDSCWYFELWGPHCTMHG